MSENTVSAVPAYTRTTMLLRFLRGSRRFFASSIAASALVAALDMVTPQVIRIVVDGCLSSQTESLPGFVRCFLDEAGGREFIIGHLYLAAVVVLVTAALSALFQYLTEYLNAKGTQRMVKTTRDLLYAHIERLPYAWHMENQTGDIIQRCTSDVTMVQNFVSEQLVQVVRIGVLIAFSVLVMLSMSLRLSLVVFLSIPLIIGYSYFFYHRIGHLFLECDENEGVLSTITQENLTGVRVVRAFGRENYERERFQRQNHIYTDAWMNLCKLLSGFWAAGDMVMGLQLLLLVAIGTVLCVRGSLTAGMLIAFISYNRRLIWPVRHLGRMISEMSKAGVSLDRLLYILNSRTEDVKPRPETGTQEMCAADAGQRAEETRAARAKGMRVADAGQRAEKTRAAGAEGMRAADAGQHAEKTRAARLETGTQEMRAADRTSVCPDMSGDIVFRNVSFGYTADEKILRDISLTIKGGTTLGILGGTGSGKSTLMHLLNRLYELQEGEITVSGVSVKDIPLFWLRSHIGMVLQEPYLFSRTLEENISIARESTMEEIRHAAQVACIDESIGRFAKGYQTMVGERGVTLSGGQKQRVAIARMLVQDTPVMVFDDSLSAVDTETDEKIRRALKQYMGRATVIIISHRISTLMNADQIIVLDRGSIVQRGTHRELLAQPGPYREIYEIQSPDAEQGEETCAEAGVSAPAAQKEKPADKEHADMAVQSRDAAGSKNRNTTVQGWDAAGSESRNMAGSGPDTESGRFGQAQEGGGTHE